MADKWSCHDNPLPTFCQSMWRQHFGFRAKTKLRPTTTTKDDSSVLMFGQRRTLSMVG